MDGKPSSVSRLKVKALQGGNKISATAVDPCFISYFLLLVTRYIFIDCHEFMTILF